MLKKARTRSRNLLRSTIPLLLALMLGACGAQTVNTPSGLLTAQELEHYEEHYLQGLEGLEEALGLTDEDRYDQAAYCWRLAQPRPIAGQDFQMDLLVSDSKGFSGLMGVRLTAVFSDEAQALAAAEAMYRQAVELYGEPSTYPGMVSRLSELAAQEGPPLQPGVTYSETWSSGRKTDLRAELLRTEEAIRLEAVYQVRAGRASG